MKIKGCYIENFGKLHQYECNLSDGCNVIYRPNGWGKSTLTVFLRVMFYGFEGENRKDDVSNERRRYNPWQGGVYGGEVSFEVNGKGYIIKRTFGSRKKEDEFKLYDAVTMLESSDYTCNIGEELFGIDSRSFMKTVYISEKACMTSATDVIAAKLAGGKELLPDVSNYDKADTVLANEINRLSPDRKTGALYKINREMTEQKSIFVKKEYVNEELDKLNSGVNKLKDRAYFDKLLIILLVCAGACLGAGLVALYNQYDKGMYSLAVGCILLLVSILYWKVRRVLLMKKRKHKKSEAEDETVDRIRQATELEKKLEAIDRAEKIYAELERQHEVYSKKYELLMKTRELLNEAKISFGAKYMPDINECFDKYYAMLNNMHNTSYGINANMELFAKEKGMYRDISLLSAGKKDIAGLCFRMALIGSMYKGERPFLILDDPFVNMDDESVLHAMEFTKIISREYQVIYFTCHKSRCIT